MHSASTFVRRVISHATHSTSNIPHINVHISQRIANRASHSKLKPGPSHSQRYQTTATHAGSVRSHADAEEDDSVQNTSFQPWNTSGDPSPSEVNKGETASSVLDRPSSVTFNVYTILEKAQPDQLLVALLDKDLGKDFLQNAPDEHFDKAILLLDPDHFIKPYMESYRYVYAYAHDAGHRHRPFRDVQVWLDGFVEHLEYIITARRDSGHPLTLSTCQQMLKWAGAMGNESFATHILRTIMAHDRLKPDLHCYNYFLEATVWNRAHSTEKFHMRVIPRHLELRASQNPPELLSGHKTANPARGITGIRADILKIFKQLVEKDMVADESTFMHLMVAMARENDMAGVESILKSVWNIDLDMLRQYDEDELQSPTFYEVNSPLRPSDRLLLTVAHTYLINNDAHTAWLLVDYISRNYDLQIPRIVWHHLLEGYTLLALDRSPSEKEQGRHLGHIDPNAFEQLFSLMIDQPHNIKPDALMLYARSRNARTQKNLDHTIQSIQELKNAVAEQRSLTDVLTKRLEVFLEAVGTMQGYSMRDDVDFFDLRRDFLKASLDFEVQYQLLQRAIVNLFSFNGWADRHNWQVRRIPQIIQEFAQYLPSTLVYKVETGEVELDCHHLRDYAEATQSGSQLRNVRFARIMLDTDAYDILLRGVRDLVQYLPCQLCDAFTHFTPSCPHDHPQPSILSHVGMLVSVVAQRNRQT